MTAPDPVFESCPIPALPPPVSVPLALFPTDACGYLSDRQSTHRGFLAHQLPGALYHKFMDAGFRRNGKLFYQPICNGCRECVPIRIPTDRFRQSKSQRRVFRRNQDLSVTVGPAISSEERFDLYRRYQSSRHDRPTDDASGDEVRASFDAFLYDSPVETIEFQHRDRSGRLLAVGICDLCAKSLSSVYFFYDPEETGRSLGTFGALAEIAWARYEGIQSYYLGYLVKNCGKMRYKSRFRPFELLNADGIWRVGLGMDDI